ncbi:MAG: ABC transporter ATP-binding protein/permease [Defluviitaleaceae bacterium]|nr:ABC transporter ATP-binding protein/permease [Defluviitaleaceae bacterium]
MKQFIFEYDLDMNMTPLQGQLIFDETGQISGIENGVKKFSFHAGEIEEAKVQPGVGCGLLYVTGRGADTNTAPVPSQGCPPSRVLCRFTMTGLKDAGEFCKVVNYYKQTGRAFIPEEAEKRNCPECGRPMMTDIRVCLFCYSKFGVFKRALSFLRPYGKTISVSQVLAMLSILGAMMFPIFNRMLIDNHLYHRTGTWGQVGVIVLMMLLTRVVAELITIGTARMFNKAIGNVSNDLRNAAYSKLQSHSMTLFAKRTPGDLIRRIMEDTETIGDFLSGISRWVFEMILMFIIAITVLFITNWQLTLLILIPVPIVTTLMYFFRRIIHARYERQWRKSSKVNSILHDIIKGIRTVKAFGSEKREIEKFANANRELAVVASKNEVLWGLLFQPMGFVIGAGEFLVQFAGGLMVLNGTLSLGSYVQFTMYLWAIFGPLRWLVNLPRWLADATTSMVKVFEVLDDESELTQAENPSNVPIAGGVSFENVYFGYKSYEPVLKNISLEISPGEMIGLVGKSGVGKSTLINLVMRLYDPNTGRIKINNTDLRDITPEHLHQNMGVVFQESFLFVGTFFENIAYGKPGATYEEVIGAAKAANAHDFITRTPDGYNTMIGEGGQSISGGERQRLSIARAIIKNPDILILDEATSSLDVETEASIQESLARITKGRTTIAIAHRLSTLRNADRLIVLDKGGVAEVGTHSELLRNKGIYYGLVMAQRKTK